MREKVQSRQQVLSVKYQKLKHFDVHAHFFWIQKAKFCVNMSNFCIFWYSSKRLAINFVYQLISFSNFFQKSHLFHVSNFFIHKTSTSVHFPAFLSYYVTFCGVSTKNGDFPTCLKINFSPKLYPRVWQMGLLHKYCFSKYLKQTRP